MKEKTKEKTRKKTKKKQKKNKNKKKILLNFFFLHSNIWEFEKTSHQQKLLYQKA